MDNVARQFAKLQAAKESLERRITLDLDPRIRKQSARIEELLKEIDLLKMALAPFSGRRK